MNNKNKKPIRTNHYDILIYRSTLVIMTGIFVKCASRFFRRSFAKCGIFSNIYGPSGPDSLFEGERRGGDRL